MEFIDLKSQYKRLEERIRPRVDRVLSQGRFILGPEVAELEEKLAKRVGVPHCVGTSSGTDGLLVSLMALGVRAGDEVIVPGFSFVATGEVVALLGARPVFVDVEPETGLLSPSDLSGVLNSKTKAAIVVDLYGQIADYAAIESVLKGVPVVADAAQSFGAEQGGVRAGSFGDLAATSFFPSKPLGAYGDGGAVFTSDPELAKSVRMITRHGQDQRYHHQRLGVNGRLDTLQAAVLLAKLEVFDEELSRRIEIARHYEKLLEEACPQLRCMSLRKGNRSTFAQFTIRLPRGTDRDALRGYLSSFQIPTAVHYPIPLYRQPAILQSGLRLPGCEALCETVLSLPFHPDLSESQIAEVVDRLASWDQWSVRNRGQA